jgi:hypothetical protein
VVTNDTNSRFMVVGFFLIASAVNAVNDPCEGHFAFYSEEAIKKNRVKLENGITRASKLDHVFNFKSRTALEETVIFLNSVPLVATNFYPFQDTWAAEMVKCTDTMMENFDATKLNSIMDEIYSRKKQFYNIADVPDRVKLAQAYDSGTSTAGLIRVLYFMCLFNGVFSLLYFFLWKNQVRGIVNASASGIFLIIGIILHLI